MRYAVIAEEQIDSEYRNHATRMVAHAATLTGLDAWLTVAWFVPEAQSAYYRTTGQTVSADENMLGRFDPAYPDTIFIRYGEPLRETLATIAHETCHAAHYRIEPAFRGATACGVADELAEHALATFNPDNGGELVAYATRSLENDKRLAALRKLSGDIVETCKEVQRLGSDDRVPLARVEAAQQRTRDLLAEYNRLALACGRKRVG